MARKKRPAIDCRRVELDGVRYVIVRESVFEQLCRKAGVDQGPAEAKEQALDLEPSLGLDRASLAERLVRRRRAAGLSQAELARRAGVRAETLNRIERGHTTPDFATVRKLVEAIGAAEQQAAARAISESSTKEPDHGNQT